MNVIQLINASKIYGKNEYKTVALNDINLIVEEGEFVSVVGPSGSGKSTLLNIMGCMDNLTSGLYYLKGQSISSFSNKKLSQIRNTTVSFVFQNFALIKEYTLYENIEIPLLFRKMTSKQKNEKIMYYMCQLGIDQLAGKKPNETSGGQQQRAAIARALVSEAEIILADEPTGALDQETGKELLRLLKQLNKEGKTILIVTHDRQVAEFCDRQIYTRDGKVVQDE